MLLRLSRYYHTLIHLKPRQLFWLVRKRMLPSRTPLRFGETGFTAGCQVTSSVRFPATPRSFLGSDAAGDNWRFINQAKKGVGYQDTGDPLWFFNLHYFDYLFQPDMDQQQAHDLLQSWLKQASDGTLNPLAWHPYPTSLRLINWCGFLLSDPQANYLLDSVVDQACHLVRELEFDIDGNHLLTNLTALGCVYGVLGSEPRLQRHEKRIKALLSAEIAEQILEDGGHYERSFVYTAIICEGLIKLALCNPSWAKELAISVVVKKMLSLLAGFCHGDYPPFNDAVLGYALPNEELQRFASSVFGIEDPAGFHLPAVPSGLKIAPSSNFASWEHEGWRLLIDGGGCLDFQPGHMHAGALGFCLWDRDDLLIAERGCWHYLAGEERQLMRETKAHSTVCVNEQDQVELWSAFRVARRAQYQALKCLESGEVRGSVASAFGWQHQRSWRLQHDGSWAIDDVVSGTKRGMVQLYFHFGIGRQVAIRKGFQQQLVIDGRWLIQLPVEARTVDILTTVQATGFHQHSPAQSVRVELSSEDVMRFTSVISRF